MQTRIVSKNLKEPSAHNAVINLINALININWEYIEKTFPEAYHQTNASGDQRNALDLIATYDFNANHYWSYARILCTGVN